MIRKKLVQPSPVQDVRHEQMLLLTATRIVWNVDFGGWCGCKRHGGGVSGGGLAALTAMADNDGGRYVIESGGNLKRCEGDGASGGGGIELLKTAFAR